MNPFMVRNRLRLSFVLRRFRRRLSSNLNRLGPERSIASSSSDSSSIQNYRYDVFISFRGPDTRNTFVDHLYAHLTRKGIFVFMDDKRLEKGDSISDQLLQAIKDSRISIVVFSENYASSTWCLDEMTAIADCKQQCSDQTVFSVFYDVDPSYVRHQNGVYQNDFDLHKKKFKKDQHKVRRWKRAMTGLADAVGWDVRNKPEFEQLENIVQAVIEKLGRKHSMLVKDLIGIQPRVQALENLLKLDVENDDFHVLGICGMTGIGKTTHAIVLYDKISYKFSVCCFIEDVSRVYRNEGVIGIHKQILRQTLDEKKLEIYSPFEISEIVRNRLHKIKVLIVLDNVDELKQLQELVISPKLLFKGSRMVITAEDEHILRVYEVDRVHKVSFLNDNEARELFRRQAFKSEEETETSICAELIPRVLGFVQCLPLAIKVIGSFLYTRDATQWMDALDRWENSPANDILNILQISVDGLPYEEKEIFLHIACFFKGEREDYVKRILDCCKYYPNIGIPRLVERSLITIRDGEIHMHEMLQELGKKIVRDHSPEKPGSWSRIWLYEDFFSASEMGTENVKAIVLDQKEDISECIVDGLSKMKELTLLILYHKQFSGSLEFLSNRLRYLLWQDFPFASLPPYFTCSDLVELNMPNSSMTRVWEGHKNAPHLKRIDLSNSKLLIETPNLDGIPKLERLDLSGCTNLIKVHPSIGFLKKLAFLNLQNCCNLDIIDFGNVTNMSSLRVLHLSGCTKLKSTPDFTRTTNLEYLDIGGCTSLSLVNESIGALTNLTFLSLRDCKELESIPYNINSMVSLQSLDLCGCLELEDLPLRQAFNSPSHLEFLILLDLGSCNLLEVPNAIGELRCLERLNLQGNNFSTIPSSINKLHRLAYLNLSHCWMLEVFPHLPFPSVIPSGGRYFKMVSRSRDHRSGLYLFDCPKLQAFYKLSTCTTILLLWLIRLIKDPSHFSCGFDIIVPWDFKNISE